MLQQTHCWIHSIRKTIGLVFSHCGVAGGDDFSDSGLMLDGLKRTEVGTVGVRRKRFEIQERS